MKKTKIICLVCQKGGVGKTTTAASLGGLLATSGQKVLLVDLDPQGNLALTFQNKPYERTIFDAFNDGKNLPIENIRENLDLVPPGKAMVNIPPQFDAFRLSTLLNEVKGQYDFIFIDCPPQISSIVANGLVACTHALIPMCCDRYSIAGVTKILEFISLLKIATNANPEVAGIVVTRFNPRKILDTHVASALAVSFPSILFKTRIRENAAISQAAYSQQDVASYKPDSFGAVDYKDLLLELLMKIK